MKKTTTVTTASILSIRSPAARKILSELARIKKPVRKSKMIFFVLAILKDKRDYGNNNADYTNHYANGLESFSEIIILYDVEFCHSMV